MTIKWHLLKYLPDVRRGEPINVGIVMEHDGGFDFRLRDVEDGKVLSSAKSWCREPANYGQWIKYLRYHLAEYGNVDIEPRAGESYRMLPSGQVSSEGIDPAGFMVELYNMLIAPPARSSRKRAWHLQSTFVAAFQCLTRMARAGPFTMRGKMATQPSVVGLDQ
jgi:hypothetical protein